MAYPYRSGRILESLQTILVMLTATSNKAHCKAVSVGLPVKTTWMLDKVPNAAAKLSPGAMSFHHATAWLRELHWLLIAFRGQFQVLVLTYKVLYGLRALILRGLFLAKYCCEVLRFDREVVGFLAPGKLWWMGTCEKAFSIIAP